MSGRVRVRLRSVGVVPALSTGLLVLGLAGGFPAGGAARSLAVIPDHLTVVVFTPSGGFAPTRHRPGTPVPADPTFGGGTVLRVRVYARDASGATLTSYSGPATWSDLSGNLSPSSPQDFVNGVSETMGATVTGSFHSDQISVTTSGVTGLSRVFSVLGPLAAIQVKLGMPVSAGGGFDLKALAYDASGNFLAGYAGLAAWSDTSGELTGPPATFTAGVSSTSAALIADPFHADRVSVQSGAVTGQTGLFNVYGPLDHLQVVGPPALVFAGVPFGVKVQARDAAENALTGYSGSASWSDLTATLSPASPGSFVGGTLKVAGATISSGGSGDQITVTSGGKQGQSAPFDVDSVPVANPDTYGMLKATTLDLPLSGVGSPAANDTDADLDPLTVTQVSVPRGGTVSISAGQIHFSYTASRCGANAGGFKYQVSDGHVSASGLATINVNCAPTGITLDNGTIDENKVSGSAVGNLAQTGDPDVETYSFSLRTSGCGGSFPESASFQTSGSQLQSAASFDFEAKASYSICVRVTDTGTPAASFEKQFTIGINNVNEPPIPQSQTVSGAVGNTVLGVGTTASQPSVNVSGNLETGATDPENDAITTVASSNQSTTGGGKVTIDADGSFVYTPPAGSKNASDTFTFKLTDGSLQSTNGTATVNIANARVWYVDASASGTGTGVSTDPFKALTSVQSVDGSNDYVYLFTGGYTGGFSMAASEQLLGRPQDLVVNNGIGSITVLSGSGSTNPSVSNSSGAGVTLADGDTIQRVDISSSGGSGAAVAGSSINTLTIGSNMTLSTSSSGGNGLDLNGGNGTIGVAATINSGTVGKQVQIQNRSGGTTTISGAVGGTGTGVNLVNNTGATINFTGGVQLSTSGNTAFNASGGGTVSVDDASVVNTLTTTTGTALDVDSTTIGSPGLNFRSISVTGNNTSPSNGIVLNATGSIAGLTVTGNGGSCTPATPTCTGGTIQGTGSHGVSLTSVSDIEFNLMSIHNTGDHGIFGNGVDNFVYRDGRIFNFGNTSGTAVSEDAMHFESTSTSNTAAGHGLTGNVTIQRDTIGPDGNFSRTPFPPLPENKGIVIRDHNDLDFNMTVTGTTFTQISNDGIDADVQDDTDATAGHGDATIDVDGSTADGANDFDNVNGRGVNFQNGTDNATARTFDLTIKNDTFNSVGIGGRWGASGRGTFNARYENNTMTNTSNDAIRSESDATNSALTPHASVNATVSGNDMGGGSIFISLHRGALSNIAFLGNTNIGGTPAGAAGGCTPCTGVHTGINLRSDRGSSLGIDIQGNTGTADGSLAQAQSALDLQTTDNGGGPSTICAKIGGSGALKNDLTENPDTAGQQVISLDPANAGTTITIEGGPGGSPGTENFLDANNTLHGSTHVAISSPTRVPSGTSTDCVTSTP